MNLFHNRPLCCASLLFVALTYAVSLFNGYSHLWSLPLLALLIGCVGIWIGKKRFPMILGTAFVTVGILCGLVHGTMFFQYKLPAYQAYIGESCEIEGRVIRRLSSQPYATTFVFELESIDGAPTNGDIKLECTYASALQPGERARLCVVGRAFREEGNYNEKTQALADGMLGAFVCEAPKSCTLLEDDGTFSYRVWFAEKNDYLSFCLRENVGGRESNFLSALLLGNRDMLDEDVDLAFERAGVSHLLALSGSHFSILLGVFDWVMRKCLHCHKVPRLIILIFLSAGYLFLTGCSPSATRAMLMFCGLSISYFLQTDQDPVTILSVTLAIIIGISPGALYDLGMWMSYVATAAIVLTVPLTEDLKITIHDNWKLPMWMYVLTVTLLTALFVGIVANVAMTVILALVFLKLPLLSVVHTLVLTLPISAALIAAIFGLMSPVFGFPCRWLADCIISLTESASELSYIVIPMSHPVSQILVALLAVSILFIVIADLKSKKWGILPLVLSVVLVVVSALAAYLPERGVQLNYIRDNDGEILVFTASGHAAAFCFTDGTSTAAQSIADTLTNAGCAELDDLILGHYHNKDTYFLSEVSERTKLRCLHLPKPLNETEEAIATRLEEIASSRGIRVEYKITDITVDKLEDCSLMREALPNGRHMALLFSATVAGQRFVYFNASVPDSSLSQAADMLMRKSQMIFVGKTGFSKNSITPIPYIHHKVKTLVIAHEDIVPLVHYASKPEDIYIKPEALAWYLE